MATYVGEGVEGLMEEGGTSRRDTVAKLLDSVGGKLESFYYAFGDIDVYAVIDVPDSVTAAALALTINASGEVTLTTTPLLTPEEIDQAVKKGVDYRAPGD
jgi:uncharacterized protein with GYD domain